VGRRFRPRNRGQAFVEFALILPVLLLLVMMALDLGRVFLAAVTINNTARVGARFAAAYPEAWSVTPDLARQADYEARIAAEWADIDCDKQTPVPGPVFGGSMTIGQPVTVTLTCTFHVLTPIISDILGNTVVLTGRAIIPITSCTETATTPGGGDEACVNPPSLAPPPTPTPTPDPCMQPPTFTVTPINPPAHLEGETQDYDVTFVNNDTSPCADRNVTFSAVVNTSTPGWTSFFDQSSFTLPVGSSANATLTVTSPNPAPAGSVTITVQATGASNQSVAYVVQTCNQPPIVAAAPATPQTGVAGSPVDWTVTVTNPDPAACLTRTFILDAVFQGNQGLWLDAWIPPTLTLGGSSSGTTTMRITSPIGASGSKDITPRETSTGTNGNQVTYVIATCDLAPTVTTLPPLTQTGAPGVARTWTVTVTNNNPAVCGQTTYSLDANFQGGQGTWTDTWSPASAPSTTIALLGGASGNVTMTITSPAGASGQKRITPRETTTGTNGTQVTYTVAACTTAQPTVSVAPNSQTGFQGESKDYTVTVTNNDSAACAPRSNQPLTGKERFNNPHFSVILNPNTLTLSPGQVGTSTMTVTPDGTTPPATYNIDVTWAAVTGSTQYVVQLAPTPSPTPTPTPTPPPTPTPTPTPTPPPPTANFDCAPLTPTVLQDVTCTDTSTGNVTSWSWDFGDGTALDTNQNPTHQYANPGTYTVVLTVDGPDGSAARTRTDYITVN